MKTLKARASIVATLLAVAAVGGESAEPTPWPRGHAPSSRELEEKTADALDLFELERAEEMLEANEKGEDSEHVFVLQEDIDAGVHSVDALFIFGDSIFEHEFRRENGFGASELPGMQRVHQGIYGGIDTFSCAGCHAIGGFDGSGAAPATCYYFGDGDDLETAVIRNPPAVLGLGLVQAIALEMTQVLQAQREQARLDAIRGNGPVRVELEANGVSFGAITALADATFEVSELQGIDSDLVVKPFGWKGHAARLRRFAERAARIHFGVQSHVDAIGYREAPDHARLGYGANWSDPDDDGITRELEEGALTALAVYLALLEAPVIIPPHEPALRERWARGSALFDTLGCSHCHRREMGLGQPFWHEAPDTTGAAPLSFNVVADGQLPRGYNLGVVPLFSDLKRHHMGERLSDKADNPSKIPRDMFLTRPLWGVAESPPYLHDASAATLPEAILAHGGEAKAPRDAFAALDEEGQGDLHIFLLSLSREPKARGAR